MMIFSSVKHGMFLHLSKFSRALSSPFKSLPQVPTQGYFWRFLYAGQLSKQDLFHYRLNNASSVVRLMIFVYFF